jgi:O-antigen ligase
MPALLHTCAFAISLFVQSWASPLAGAWVFFHLAGCAVLLHSGDGRGRHGPLWYAALAWLLAVGASAFLFAPVRGGAAFMWVLAAMPSLALCLRGDQLKPYFAGFLGVTALYAAGLVLQLAFDTHTTAFFYEGRHSWPLIDPNNGAAVVILALLPGLWLALFHNPRWWLLLPLFATALWATGSKAGFVAGAVGALVLFTARYGRTVFLLAATAGAAGGASAFFFRPDGIVTFAHSFADRFPIWEASWPLVFIRPLLGLGLGSFPSYYEQVRTEQYTAGWHTHNDLLQFAVEMGIPAALVFSGLVMTALLSTRRANLASGVTLMAVLAMSMVEFQFYIPSVSLLAGLALAFHMQPNRKVSP